MDNLQNKETPNKDNSQNDAPAVPSEKQVRHDQQMEGARKEVQKYRDLAIDSEVKRAELDANSIIELHEKDPKMANEVAVKFGYSNYEDVKSSLATDTQTNDTNSSKEDFTKWYNERKAKDESSNANSEAEKILDTLEWDIKEEAVKHYKSMTDNRNITVWQATEFAKMATLYVNRDTLKSEKLQEWILNFGNTGLWNSSASTKKVDSKNKEFWNQVFWWKFAHLYK